MSFDGEMDVNNRTPRLEIATLQRVETFDGLEVADSNSINCSSERLLVRGKADAPLVQKTSLVQSLLISGQDRRSRVLDTTFDPWKRICSLQIRSKDGSEYVGTGWLAGPRLIITAGHCVHHSTYGGWAQQITVIPGRDGSEEPFGSFVSNNFYSMKKWFSSADENYDIGAIILSEDIGLKLGYFSFGVYPDDLLKSHLINISGYPASVYGEEQMHHANRISDATKHKLYYDIDTEGGQSGSPIWLYTQADSKPMVVGVHSYGAGHSNNANSGVRITQTLAEQIAKWQAIK